MVCVVLFHPHLSPLPSRERRILWLDWLVVAPHTLPLWIADQVRNDVTMRCIVL